MYFHSYIDLAIIFATETCTIFAWQRLNYYKTVKIQQKYKIKEKQIKIILPTDFRFN